MIEDVKELAVKPILSNWSPDNGYLNTAAFLSRTSGPSGLGNSIYGPKYWNVVSQLARTR